MARIRVSKTLDESSILSRPAESLEFIMIKFIKESREELRKVVWPGRDEVFSSTMVVLIAVIVISLFLFMTDWTFEKIFNILVNLGRGS